MFNDLIVLFIVALALLGLLLFHFISLAVCGSSMSEPKVRANGLVCAVLLGVAIYFLIGMAIVANVGTLKSFFVGF